MSRHYSPIPQILPYVCILLGLQFIILQSDLILVFGLEIFKFSDIVIQTF